MRPTAPSTLALILAALPVAAQDAPGPAALQMIGYGVICDIALEGQRPAPGTLSGVLNLVDQDREIDVTTQAVPADLGLSFGLRAALPAEAAEAQSLEITVTHPPMGPGGMTRERWHVTVAPGDPMITLFTFEEPYELVQGSWVFQIAARGRMLLEQRFEVTAPGSVPAVQRRCFGARLSS